MGGDNGVPGSTIGTLPETASIAECEAAAGTSVEKGDFEQPLGESAPREKSAEITTEVADAPAPPADEGDGS